MAAHIINTEGLINKVEAPFERLMELIPGQQREDRFLKRLIVIRLKLDGEEATRDYITQKIKHAAECSYSGSLFDFMKDDHEEAACQLRLGDGNETA